MRRTFACIIGGLLLVGAVIAAVVLLFFGTGSVQGFATTLLLGVVTSMLTAIVISRFLLVNTARIVKNPAVFLCSVESQSEEVK